MPRPALLCNVDDVRAALVAGDYDRSLLVVVRRRGRTPLPSLVILQDGLVRLASDDWPGLGDAIKATAAEAVVVIPRLSGRFRATDREMLAALRRGARPLALGAIALGPETHDVMAAA